MSPQIFETPFRGLSHHQLALQGTCSDAAHACLKIPFPKLSEDAPVGKEGGWTALESTVRWRGTVCRVEAWLGPRAVPQSVGLYHF